MTLKDINLNELSALNSHCASPPRGEPPEVWGGSQGLQGQILGLQGQIWGSRGPRSNP